MAWEALKLACGQLRVSAMGGVYGLDYSAMLQMAEAMGALNDIFTTTLPGIEAILVRAQSGEGE